jgi:MFS family permease
VLAGFRFAATEERVRVLLMLLALVALMGVPSATLMPVFASTVLRGDARTLGWLMGAQGGGALVAGLVLASRRGTEWSYRWIGGACGTLGVMLVLFALSRALWLSLAISVLLGGTTMIEVSATNALIQAMTPDALRGRVMAIFAMIFSLFSPVGSVMAGSLATASDPRVPLVVGGVACTLGAIGFGRWSRRRRPTIDALEAQPGAALETRG